MREVEYLKTKDERVAAKSLKKSAMLTARLDTDLFSSVVHHIIGQQISTKAQATIWARMKAQFGEVNAESISAADIRYVAVFGNDIPKSRIYQRFC